jgi:hypothetical protein
MLRKIRITPERRAKIDAVTQIVKRVCGLPQEDAFNIAKHACVFGVSKRYAGGKHASTGE